MKTTQLKSTDELGMSSKEFDKIMSRAVQAHPEGAPKMKERENRHLCARNVGWPSSPKSDLGFPQWVKFCQVHNRPKNQVYGVITGMDTSCKISTKQLTVKQWHTLRVATNIVQ